MDKTPVVSDLYVPLCVEENGPSQPVAAALWLEQGKNSCLHHFLKRCRTHQQRLSPEQRTDIPETLLERITLEWSEGTSGVYEGQPSGCLDTPLALMTNLRYKLHPAG